MCNCSLMNATVRSPTIEAFIGKRRIITARFTLHVFTILIGSFDSVYLLNYYRVELKSKRAPVMLRMCWAILS